MWPHYILSRLLSIRRFCIPFTLATTMGLSALALDLPITLSEAGEGEQPPLHSTPGKQIFCAMQTRSSAVHVLHLHVSGAYSRPFSGRLCAFPGLLWCQGHHPWLRRM